MATINYNLNSMKLKDLELLTEIDDGEMALTVVLHNESMKCPRCESTQISKKSSHHGKHNYICKYCKRQFVEFYDTKGYSDDAKRLCVRMYLDGMSLRGIERVTGINHNTIINWVRQIAPALSDMPESNEISEVT